MRLSVFIALLVATCVTHDVWGEVASTETSKEENDKPDAVKHVATPPATTTTSDDTEERGSMTTTLKGKLPKFGSKPDLNLDKLGGKLGKLGGNLDKLGGNLRGLGKNLGSVLKSANMDLKEYKQLVRKYSTAAKTHPSKWSYIKKFLKDAYGIALASLIIVGVGAMLWTYNGWHF
ncbi:hypothetical protein PsorP6_014973 [Peronosclerospora sorghi]|uniref:Uncharacterized protein n=1 Tax=Peronosclerospora sorghi TaxID=230839 RepID=A0ACC0VTM3_9STRA|nr:hypothetical protein PsorP6_014973 [Peronosclerospora sorghi]